jgi:peptide deformylase
VTQFDDALQRLVIDLMDTCRLPGRAGLAAPQIGVDLRVFAYNVDGLRGYVVNPELVSTDGPLEESPEGCLSIPGLFVDTPRAAHATVRGMSAGGQPVEVEGRGLLARCLQHETDHLEGRLFVGRLQGEARRQAMAAIRNSVLAGEWTE